MGEKILREIVNIFKQLSPENQANLMFAVRELDNIEKNSKKAKNQWIYEPSKFGQLKK